MASHTRSSASFVIQPTQTSEVESWLFEDKLWDILIYCILYTFTCKRGAQTYFVPFKQDYSWKISCTSLLYSFCLSYYLSIFQGFMHPKLVCGQLSEPSTKKHQLLGWSHENLRHLNRGTSSYNLEIPSFGISEASTVCEPTNFFSRFSSKPWTHKNKQF